MHKKLRTKLVCPVCKQPLQNRSGSKDLVCKNDGLVFPVIKGIPMLLEMDARKINLDE